MNVSSGWRGGRWGSARLEGNDLERHAKDLRNFFPTVSRVTRIQASSSLLACPVSVSCTTFVSTRIVVGELPSFRNPGIPTGGIPGSGHLSSPSHSYTTFAIFTFLQTMMKTGG